MAKSDAPEIQGRYVLLKVGKAFDSRRLRAGLKKALRTGELNGEESVPVISLICQLELHLNRTKETDEASHD